MKLLFFNDFQLGVLKSDNTVVDVMDVVRNIPHTGPHDLISGLIERFGEYKSKLEEAAGSGKGVALSSVRIRPPLPKPVQHRLHGRELHGRRHARRAGADQRVPQVAERHHRQRRYDGAAGRAGDDLRRRGGNRPRHRQTRNERLARPMRWSYIFGYMNFIDGSARGLPPSGNTFYQMKSRDTFCADRSVPRDGGRDQRSAQAADQAVGEWRAEAELQHERHGAQDPALYRVDHVDPHARARRHPRDRHQPSRASARSRTATRSRSRPRASGRLTFNVRDELKRTWGRETRLDRQNKKAEVPTTPQLTGKCTREGCVTV